MSFASAFRQRSPWRLVVGGALSLLLSASTVSAQCVTCAGNDTLAGTAAKRGSDRVPAPLGIFTISDLGITKTDSSDPVNAGDNLTYTITVTNNGPDAAGNASWSDTLPAGTAFVSLSAAAGWSCTTPAVGSGGTVSCSNAIFAVGNAVFTLTVNVDATVAAGTVLSNTATATSATTEGNPGDESDTETTTVAGSADLQLSKTDSPDPVTAGTNITYQLTLANNGPSNAASATFSDTLPAGTTFVSLSTTGPWSCTTPAVGASGTVSCTNASFGVTVDFFTIVVEVDPSVAAGTVLSNTATIGAATSDPNSGNESATATTTVTASADVSLTKTLDTAGPYTLGQSVTYTIVVANAGPSTATNIGVADTPTNQTVTNVTGACASFSPCTIASLAPGANTTITVTATIDSSGAFSNSATATAAETDPGGSNNTASDGDVASQVNVVEVTKAVSGTFVQGTNVTYTIVLTNNMTVNQPDNFGHEFTDNLPAGLTLIPGSFTATSGTNGSVSNIFFWDGAIPSGGTVTLTFQATISPTASGSICNQGQSIFDKDGDTQNESSELTDDPSTAAANDPTCFNVVQANIVEVTKAVSGTFVQGTNVTYTIVLTNNMTVNQPDNVGHEFTDNLPAGLTLIPGSFAATSGTNGSVSNLFFWDGAIPSGGTVTLTFQAAISPTAGGQICNQGQSIFDRNGDTQNEASELTDDPSTAASNDPTCFNVVQANAVEVTKAVSGTFVQGTNITYTIVLTNNMTVNQPDNVGHEFTDNLPAGLTLIPGSFTATSGTNGSASNLFFWDGAIPSGGTVTLTFQAAISPTASGQVCNQGQSIFDKDGDAQNESSELTDDPSTAASNDPTCFNVVQANAVEVTKAVSGTFVQGTNVTYTTVLTNNMTVNQPDNVGHEFTDNLPAGLTLIPGSFTATSGTNGSASNLFFWDGAIPSGGTVTLTFQATISPTASGQVCNQGQSIFDKDGDTQNEASELTDDPSTAAVNDSTCFMAAAVPSTDVSVAVADTPDPVTPGGNLTYTITANNGGSVDAAGASLGNPLPAGTTFTSLAAPAGWNCTAPAVGATGTVACTNASMAPGNAVFTLVVGVDAGAAGGTVISDTATVASTTADPTPGNNSATATTTVGTSSADLSVTKTDTPDPVAAGGNLTYTISVSNAGPSAASNAALSDTLPAGTTFVSLTSAAGWTCTTPAVGSTGSVGCTIASLGAGSAAFTLVVAVDAGVVGGTVISNTATASSATADPTPGNNSATATTTVTAPAVVSAAKTVGASAAPGGAITYTIVLRNTGTGTQGDHSGDEFTDVLPAGLALVSTSATSGSAVANAGANTVTWNGSIAAGSMVTITIQATVRTNVPPGTSIMNQGTVRFDADGNGSNEATASTDDPGTGANGDGTAFTVSQGAVAAPPILVPTASLPVNLLLSAMLALIACVTVRRRAG